MGFAVSLPDDKGLLARRSGTEDTVVRKGFVFFVWRKQPVRGPPREVPRARGGRTGETRIEFDEVAETAPVEWEVERDFDREREAARGSSRRRGEVIRIQIS